MADVFISYARANAREARRIAAHLEELGFSTWFDQQLPAHRAYTDVIEEQLEGAAAVLVLWSPEAVASQWVRSEANRARESGRLVQMRLGTARLPMPFDQIQCADIPAGSLEPDAGGWQPIAAALADLTGARAAAEHRNSPGRSVSRRQIMLAGGAVGLAGLAAAVGTWWGGEDRLSPEARLLLQKGMDALQVNDALDPDDPGATLQAIALLNQATEAAPNSPEAWGGLALAYAVRRGDTSVPDRDGMDPRARSAAARALQLDRRQPTALGALQLLIPVFRNWTLAERSARDALTQVPTHPLLLFILSSILGSVGRWRAAVEAAEPFDRSKWRIPGADRRLLLNAWSSGDLQEADRVQLLLAETWPQHPQVWKTRLAYLMYSGRPGEALSLLEDAAERPPGDWDAFVDVTARTCRALEPGADRAAGVAANLDDLGRHPTAALSAAQACAALGAGGAALSILDGYYFGTGEWAATAPPGGDRDRRTAALFQPPMRDLWRSDGFGRLMERTGLGAYWRSSGTRPDFRTALDSGR